MQKKKQVTDFLQILCKREHQNGHAGLDLTLVHPFHSRKKDVTSRDW